MMQEYNISWYQYAKAILLVNNITLPEGLLGFQTLRSTCSSMHLMLRGKTEKNLSITKGARWGIKET